MFDRAAQLILAVRDLDRAPASLLERALERGDDLPERDAALAQQRRQQPHLVLLLEPADRRHFRDAGGRLQRRLDRALVQQPQLAQVAGAVPVDERVLEDPADAAGVRADDDVRVGGQLRANRVQPIGDVLANGGAAGRRRCRMT